MNLSKILESQNLVEDLDKETLKDIYEAVKSGYDQDEISRSGWKMGAEKNMKLATQITEKKTFPWPDAANVKFPLVTIAVIQFAARAYPSLIPPRDAVKGLVIGLPTPEKEARAKRVGDYMTYQVLEEIPDWDEDMDKLIHIVPILGNAFKKTFFDPEMGIQRSQLVLPTDLVADYYGRSIEEVSRKTHVFRLYPYEVEQKFRSKFFSRVSLPDSTMIRKGTEVSDQAHDLTAPGSNNKDTPYEVLEQHCWYDLDDDGLQEPYIVTIIPDAEECVRIVPRFNEDSIQVNEKNEIIRIIPDEYFTNFIFIPDPESGIYGFGFGRLLGPLNETVNTTINQLLDGGTLSNLQSGFLSRGIRIKTGSNSFSPGEWKFVESSFDDLRKGIFPLPVKEPSMVLFNLLGVMVEQGQKLGTVSDLMMGESPGQNQPFSTTQRVLEEGLRMFSSIHKRLHKSLKKEYRKLFRLNFEFLEEEKYFTVLDIGGDNKNPQVFRKDFNNSDVDVVPSSDPDITSEMIKLAKNEALMAFVQLGTVNPQEATRRILEAQNHSGIEDLMKMPEPQPDFETQLKMAEFQHKQQMDSVEIKFRALELEAGIFKDRAQGILTLAKAQSLEDKTILEQLKLELEGMRNAEERFNTQMKDLRDAKLQIVKMQSDEKRDQIKSDERKKSKSEKSN